MYVTFPSSMWNWCISAMPSNQWLKLRSKHSSFTFLMIVICSVFKEPKWYSPASSDLKLSRSIPEEIAFDPGWDVTCNCGCYGLWGFIYRTHQILNARQTMNIGEVLIFILWTALLPACGEKKNIRSEDLCTMYFGLERYLNLPVLLFRRFIEDMLVCLWWLAELKMFQELPLRDSLISLCCLDCLIKRSFRVTWCLCKTKSQTPSIEVVFCLISLLLPWYEWCVWIQLRVTIS